MFSKTTLFLALTALTTLATAASPPGCLLGAVNTYQNPADISAVCKAKDATGKIAEYCGDATADALAAFADICNKEGVKVSTDIPTTATGSLKPSGTGSPNGNNSSGGPGPTGTGSPSGGNGGSPTNSGAPGEATGAAGRVEMGLGAFVGGLVVMVAAL